jgi:hypothetical protein
MLASRADNRTLSGVFINADCGLGIRGIRHVAGGTGSVSNVRLICASHTPMMEFIHPAPDVEAGARAAFADLAREVEAFDPQLIVMFAPDHFNGFFYDLMPSFCLGVRATGAGTGITGRAICPCPGVGARSGPSCSK